MGHCLYYAPGQGPILAHLGCTLCSVRVSQDPPPDQGGTLVLTPRVGYGPVSLSPHGCSHWLIAWEGLSLGACWDGLRNDSHCRSPGKAFVEGDASSASYFLAGAAITGGSVRVEGCGLNSLQVRA